MIPNLEITGATLDAMIFYTAILGLLIYIGTFLRLKVGILGKLFIPASLIAGAIGLILGPYGLSIIPKPMMDFWSALPGRLIVLVFAPMLMGSAMPKLKHFGNLVGPQVAFSYMSTFVQYAVPLLIGVAIFNPLWNVNNLFGTIVEQGWAGGHGSAGGMSAIFNELNYVDGGSLSVTSATVGLLVGILGGMVAINLAVRKGWTTVLKTTTSLKTGGKGIINKDEQTPGSMVTINKDIIEPFAFHASLMALAILIGWFLTKGLNQYFSISIGLFVTSMLGGLLVQSVISKTKWSAGVDKGTFQRIQGLALEFLVASAVASIKIPIVIKYALPLIIQQTVMLVVMFWMLFWLCRRMFPENWFEHGIVLFGAFTGVVAIGLMLLRTVDPEMKTNVGQVFAARSPFTGPLIGGGALTALTPSLVVKYGALSVGLTYLGGFVILFLAMRFIGWWYPVNRKMS